MRAKAPVPRTNAGLTSAAPSFALTVGPEDDRFEREAQRMAERVVSPERSPLAVPVFAPAARAVQRETDEEEDEAAAPEEEGELQREVAGGAPPPPAPGGAPAGLGQPAPAGVTAGIARVRGGGAGLPAPVRREMEGAFRTDFSQVRLHTGSEADRLNRAVSARAFTLGRDVFFRTGAYQPGSHEGKRLLAHELTHVVQQRGGGGVIQREACFIPGNRNAPYAAIGDGRSVVGPNRDFGGSRHDALLRGNAGRLNTVGPVNLTTAPVTNYQSDGNGAVLVTKDAVQFALAEVDHIVPAALGGGNTAHNAQVLSSAENNAKGDTYPWPAAAALQYNGVRVYLPEVHSGVAAGSRLAVNGAGAAAQVTLPAATQLAAGTTIFAAGGRLATGMTLPAGLVVPAGFPLGLGPSAFGSVLSEDLTLPANVALAGPLLGPRNVALAAGTDLPAGYRVPAGYTVPGGFPLALGLAPGPIALVADVVLAAPHRLLGPILSPRAQLYASGTNLLAGSVVAADSEVPAGFPVPVPALGPTALAAPVQIHSAVTLSGAVTVGAAGFNLAGPYAMPAPIARLNGLMPANFYPP